jgi:hypothetical protein
LASVLGLRLLAVYGGVPLGRQIQQLRRGEVAKLHRRAQVTTSPLPAARPTASQLPAATDRQPRRRRRVLAAS